MKPGNLVNVYFVSEVSPGKDLAFTGMYLGEGHQMHKFFDWSGSPFDKHPRICYVSYLDILRKNFKFEVIA